MANILPFAAVRPKSDVACQICELPYDVFSSAEARNTAAGNPMSFLRISRPEIEFDQNINHYQQVIYDRGARNFRNLLNAGYLIKDTQPCYYVYRQIMGEHSQAGFVAIASCQDYADNIIKKHELTRHEKEFDRVRHIEALEAQTGPALLTCRFSTLLREILAEAMETTSWVDFVSTDHIRHTGWMIQETDLISQIQAGFREIAALYIADGHHRTAAANRVFQKRGGSGSSAHFLAVIFPHDKLQILPYNRIIKDLNGKSIPEFLQALSAVFHITSGTPKPSKPHQISLYLDRKWHNLEFRAELLEEQKPLERLDVHLLQRHVLGPLLAIQDPRSSDRLDFVGGIRSTSELEESVDKDQHAAVFSLYPTQMEDLMMISDSGDIMPPKSTWFEPKLRDGLYCHLIA